MTNRCAFKICEQPMLLRRHRFKDVTQIAREWGSRFEMQVEHDFLKQFMGATGDDEGELLVGSLVEAFDRVLCGRVDSRSTSHGEWVTFEFVFVATRRKTQAHSQTRIRAVFGPCTSDSPVLFVRWVPVLRDRHPRAY